MARDEQGKWIPYEEWKRRMVEKGKLPTLAPAPSAMPAVSIPAKAQVTPKPEAPKPLPARPPEDIAYMTEFEKRHPTLAKVLRGWKTLMERIPGMAGTPWGQKVGEVVGRTLIGAEPPIESPKLSKAGEITAGLVGGGLAIAGAVRGLGIPGAAGAVQQVERKVAEVATKAAPRVAEAVSRLPALARATGRAALVEAPAWWAYERMAYPEEHKPELKQLPEYMAQFGAFVGLTGAAAEALPRVVRYLRDVRVPKTEVKPPEVKVGEVKPPAAEVKPPEVPTAEVKPPEAPAPKPPEVPPAEELPVKVGQRMTARRKRTGKEYTGVVERVYRGKQGQLLADVRLDDGAVKTIPASRKHTEWRIPEVEPKEAKPEFKIGEEVHLTDTKGNLLTEPRKIVDIQEKDGVKYIRVEGTTTYYPESQVERPAPRAEAPKVELPEAPKAEVAEVPSAPRVKPEVPPAPAKPYEGLRPGTEQWMKVWREHPELQEEMLAYAREKGYLPPKPEAEIKLPTIETVERVPEPPQIQEAPPGLPVSPLTPEQQQQARIAVREIVTTFERLGTPIRTGRYYQKARGIYKRGQK
ncbi:hypothetical protein HPY42_06490 [Coprothermobacteraceae bacterium]|nr:hypothetical protein [Coprothermobacteraceae bacterium]